MSFWEGKTGLRNFMYKKKKKKKKKIFFSRNHINFKRGKGFFTPGNNSHNLLLDKTL